MNWNNLELPDKPYYQDDEREMFRKIPYDFEAIYCEDNRHWSKSNYILWVEIASACVLNCKYCHYHQKKKLWWLKTEDLSQMKDYIENREFKEARLHITPTLGDILLSPYCEDILRWCVKNKAVINLMSYLPHVVSLRELQVYLADYSENCCLCWSLHAYTDKERHKLFNHPHQIRSVLPILNSNHYLKDTVYSYSNLDDKGLFGLLNPQSIKITMTPFVDYSTNTIYENKSLVKYPNQRILKTNLELMKVSYPNRHFVEM